MTEATIGQLVQEGRRRRARSMSRWSSWRPTRSPSRSRRRRRARSAEIVAKDGETVAVGALLGQISEGAGKPAAKEPPKRRRKQPRPPRADRAELTTGRPDLKTDSTRPINAGRKTAAAA
ncbi:MAG: hypothetical protein MZV49_03560 [Rhodopseudomonas palustris]|nr:hypothetical protein [Rhodopseudomonas palustris]